MEGRDVIVREAVASSSSSKVAFTFEELISADFDVLSINANEFGIISHTVKVLIVGIVGSLAEVNVCEDVLNRFVVRIGSLYRDTPYHNFHHAMCVMRETAVILLNCRVIECFSKKALFVSMIAALVHDVDHPGTNNDFEINSNSPLAILYNDNSVLENHHLSLTFNVLQDKNYDIFQGWTIEERKRARKVLINAVLATDMKFHQQLQTVLQTRSQCSPAFDFTQFDERMEFIKIVLHSADIANVARPARISARISELVTAEFRRQVEKERALGIPVTPFMVVDDQVTMFRGEHGFASHVAKPYFQALARCFPEFPSMNFVPQINVNIEYWSEQVAILSVPPTVDTT